MTPKLPPPTHATRLAALLYDALRAVGWIIPQTEADVQRMEADLERAAPPSGPPVAPLSPRRQERP